MQSDVIIKNMLNTAQDTYNTGRSGNTDIPKDPDKAKYRDVKVVKAV